ncbi:MAG: hypothetical protein ABI780_08380 [Ardenticatenales bacterium]
MRSPTYRPALAAGVLFLSLGLAACSSPTPSRPQDNAPAGVGGDGASGTPAAPSSSSGFHTDPISGGPEVWKDLYPPESTVDPDAPYPPPLPTPANGAYPAPDGSGDGAAEPSSGATTNGATEPTAAPTKSGG